MSNEEAMPKKMWPEECWHKWKHVTSEDINRYECACSVIEPEMFGTKLPQNPNLSSPGPVEFDMMMDWCLEEDIGIKLYTHNGKRLPNGGIKIITVVCYLLFPVEGDGDIIDSVKVIAPTKFLALRDAIWAYL